MTLTQSLDQRHDAPRSGALPADEQPYTTALLLRLSAALGEIAGHEAPLGLAPAAEVAAILAAYGLALVEPDRARMWIDERVYSGALFRLRLAESPPSITLPLDVLPHTDHLVRIAIETTIEREQPHTLDHNPIPRFLDRRKADS